MERSKEFIIVLFKNLCILSLNCLLILFSISLLVYIIHLFPMQIFIIASWITIVLFFHEVWCLFKGIWSVLNIMKKAVTPLCLLSCLFIGFALNMFIIDYFYIDNLYDQFLCTIMCAGISSLAATFNIKEIPK